MRTAGKRRKTPQGRNFAPERSHKRLAKADDAAIGGELPGEARKRRPRVGFMPDGEGKGSSMPGNGRKDAWLVCQGHGASSLL